MKAVCRNLRGARALVIAVSTLSVLAFKPASAQAGDNGFSLGIGGGFAKGFSSPLITNTSGYYLLSTLDMPSPLRMLRPRADLTFADWGGTHVTALTGNLLFTPLATKRVAPYALAGAGAYAVPGSTVKSGWTLGLGLRVPGETHAITIESRVHSFLRGPHDALPFDTGNRWRTVWMPIGMAIHF